MKISILNISVIILLFVLINSCTKQDTLSPMVFKFIGIKDTTTTQGRSVTNTITIYNLGGSREKITFTAQNLPNGVQVTHTPSSAYQESSVAEVVSVAATADTGTFTIQIIGTAERGNKYIKDYHIHIIPPVNHAPVISLSGGSPFVVTLNSSYTEPGFIAMDAEDGNITANVHVSGTVNKDSAGVYYISYVVSDSQGLKDSVTRAVSVTNNLNYLNILFTDTTYNLNFGTHYEWLTTLSASVTINNQFTIFKLSNCFPANPILTYDPVKDSIFMLPQTFLAHGISDTLPINNYTFQGNGKLYNNTNGIIRLELYYTQSYTDSTGAFVVRNKKDVYAN